MAISNFEKKFFTGDVVWNYNNRGDRTVSDFFKSMLYINENGVSDEISDLHYLESSNKSTLFFKMPLILNQNKYFTFMIYNTDSNAFANRSIPSSYGAQYPFYSIAYQDGISNLNQESLISPSSNSEGIVRYRVTGVNDGQVRYVGPYNERYCIADIHSNNKGDWYQFGLVVAVSRFYSPYIPYRIFLSPTITTAHDVITNKKYDCILSPIEPSTNSYAKCGYSAWCVRLIEQNSSTILRYQISKAHHSDLPDSVILEPFTIGSIVIDHFYSVVNGGTDVIQGFTTMSDEDRDQNRFPNTFKNGVKINNKTYKIQLNNGYMYGILAVDK